MELTNEKLKAYSQRLLLSRLRLLSENGFYGILLMNAKFGVDIKTPTAYTDGEKIVFGCQFLDDLSDPELDFVLMHEVLHVALRHVFRSENFDPSLFNIACDIVVNSNVLYSQNMDVSKITLRKYGEAMHLAPDNKEGYLYTAEEVYEMLKDELNKNEGASNKSGKNNNEKNNEQNSSSNGGGNNNNSGESRGNSKSSGSGKNLVNNGKITDEGRFDDHDKWGKTESGKDVSELDDEWASRVRQAIESVSVRESSKSRGTMPMCAKRILEDLNNPVIDWRTILNNFIQEEICDYSFSPPDKRFVGDFFLPDFNEKDEKVDNILFMIDTSGSMSNKDINDCYTEIKGAIDQFGGKLTGLLGFFDGKVVPPIPFMDEDEFKLIKAYGGGGTNFHCIFDYVNNEMTDNPPKSIVILTDGYAPFPQEEMARDIPVLWIINNKEITPPFGIIARLIKGKK